MVTNQSQPNLDGGAILITLRLPPPSASPNARTHYRKKAEETASYRQHAKDEAMAAAFQYDLSGPYTNPVVGITYYSRTVRFADPDNILASLKAAFDGLTDAGIWEDDRDTTYLPVRREKDADNPRVELRVSG